MKQFLPIIKRSSFQEWFIVLAYVFVWLAAGVYAVAYPRVGSYVLAVGYTLLLVCILITYRNKMKKPSMLLILRSILWGTLPLIIELIVLGIVYSFNSKLIGNSNTELILQLLRKQWIYIAYVVIIAPILEEIVFRKCLFHRLFSWLISFTGYKYSKVITILSAILVGLVFAQMHGAMVGMTYILLSLFLQYMYLHYKNVWSNIIAHVTFNSMTILLLVIATIFTN